MREFKVIDVWATPHRDLFENASEEYPSVAFSNIDLNQDSSILRKFDVRGIPAVLFVENNTVVDQYVGIPSECNLNCALGELIK